MVVVVVVVVVLLVVVVVVVVVVGRMVGGVVVVVGSGGRCLGRTAPVRSIKAGLAGNAPMASAAGSLDFSFGRGAALTMMPAGAIGGSGLAFFFGRDASNCSFSRRRSRR